MKNELLVTLGVCVVAITSCAPQHTVTKMKSISREGAPAGIYYSLPKTVVTIKVPITKTTIETGPFICYADRLGIDYPKALRNKSRFENWQKQTEDCEQKVVDCRQEVEDCKQQVEDGAKQAGDCKKLIDDCNKEFNACQVLQTDKKAFLSKVELYKLGSPETTTAARPDKDQVYRVEIRSGYRQTRELMVELSEMGLMIVGDSTARDKTLDYVVATVKAASRYAAASPAKGFMALHEQPLIDPRAEALSLTIGLLRDRRRRLVSGGVAAGLTSLSVPALDRMLKEIDKEEAKLLASFWTTTTKAANIIVEYIPEEEPPKEKHELFKFSSKTGISDVACLPSGLRVQIPDGFGKAEIDKSYAVTLALKLIANVASDPKGSEGSGSAHRRADEKPLGFRYRIPALARIEIEQTRVSPEMPLRLGEHELLIAQLGAVVALPAGVKSTNSQFRIELYEKTGALKKATVKSTAIDPALIDKLGDAAENFGKAAAARRAASAAKGSPLKRATDQLSEYQGLVKSLGSMGLPVPAWAIEAATTNEEDTGG